MFQVHLCGQAIMNQALNLYISIMKQPELTKMKTRHLLIENISLTMKLLQLTKPILLFQLCGQTIIMSLRLHFTIMINLQTHISLNLNLLHMFSTTLGMNAVNQLCHMNQPPLHHGSVNMKQHQLHFTLSILNLVLTVKFLNQFLLEIITSIVRKLKHISHIAQKPHLGTLITNSQQ